MSANLAAIEEIQNSIDGIEATALIMKRIIADGRIDVIDPNIDERYLCGLMSGQVAAAHLVAQQLKTLASNEG